MLTCSSVKKKNRRGSIIVLSAAFMIVMLAFIAFAFDMGNIVRVRTELQRSADAAALAGAWQLIDEGLLSGDTAMNVAIANAGTQATQYAAMNPVSRAGPAINYNVSNSPTGDIVVGHLGNFSYSDTSLALGDPSKFNAVQVRVQKTAAQNGAVPMFFAQVLGINGVDVDAVATAALGQSIKGFRAPSDGSNLGILPISVDEPTWNDLIAGNGDDGWTYDKMSKVVQSGGDGVLEINIYPKGNGSPGNRGTVDIGSNNNNSTADLSRQITDGVTPADLAYHGGELKFDANGELALNADPGIGAGVKDELASIIGQPRAIPVFRTLTGNGNNATYTIIKWVGIRIVDVKLTGNPNQKRVIIQPAVMVMDGAIAGDDGSTSDFVYTRPVLVR